MYREREKNYMFDFYIGYIFLILFSLFAGFAFDNGIFFIYSFLFFLALLAICFEDFGVWDFISVCLEQIIFTFSDPIIKLLM